MIAEIPLVPLLVSVLKELVLAGSMIAAGVAAYLAFVVDGPRALRAPRRSRRRRRALFFFLARTGFAGVVVIVATAVAQLPFLKAEARTWAYLIALTCAAIGYIGIAVTHEEDSPHA